MIISIIIPVYNEEKTINTLLKKVLEEPLPENIRKEIIVINDGSTDGTAQVIRQYSSNPFVKLLTHTDNRGKTAALRLGIKSASGDLILIQDADLEYDPNNYPALLEPILNGQSKIVYGSRFKGSIKSMTIINRLANNFSNLSFNLIYRTKLSDINTCFKLFSRECMEGLDITSRDFMFETEVTAKLINKGFTILEVPIHYQARSKQEGKKINWKKALWMYWGIFKFRNA